MFRCVENSNLTCQQMTFHSFLLLETAYKQGTWQKLTNFDFQRNVFKNLNLVHVIKSKIPPNHAL